MTAITLYIGLNETKWNRHPIVTGGYACVSPVYGSTERTKTQNSVAVPYDTAVRQDSGAFCDGPGIRLSFRAALDRQIAHAEKYGYADLITERASYDLLIDEKWVDGTRHKERWSIAEAEQAVSETIRAAEFAANHRNGVGLILSAQGVGLEQYMRCAQEIVPMLSDRDVFGMGGWCILGKMKRYMSVFEQTISQLIPYLGSQRVKQVHLWGVVYANALGKLLWLCDQYGITLSTDSAGPSRRPAFGVWGYADWVDKTYKRPPVETRGLERARHVQATREWLAGFRSTQYYRPIERNQSCSTLQYTFLP
jgi:hypothetical protein